MPTASLHPCGPNCPTLVVSGRCPKHRAEVSRYRGKTDERGYNTRWERCRAAFLRERCDCDCHVTGPAILNAPTLNAPGNAPSSNGLPLPPLGIPLAPPWRSSAPDMARTDAGTPPYSATPPTTSLRSLTDVSHPRGASALCPNCHGTGLLHSTCEECSAEGKIVRATDVDHIWNFHEYGWHLRLNRNNLQGLCARHHTLKTQAESGQISFSPYQLARRRAALEALQE